MLLWMLPERCRQAHVLHICLTESLCIYAAVNALTNTACFELLPLSYQKNVHYMHYMCVANLSVSCYSLVMVGHQHITITVQCSMGGVGPAHLKDLPSCLRRLWKTTVLAGAFTPMAKVSVENSTLMSPRQNSISTTSFMIGSSPMCDSTSLLFAFG